MAPTTPASSPPVNSPNLTSSPPNISTYKSPQLPYRKSKYASESSSIRLYCQPSLAIISISPIAAPDGSEAAGLAEKSQAFEAEEFVGNRAAETAANQAYLEQDFDSSSEEALSKGSSSDSEDCRTDSFKSDLDSDDPFQNSDGQKSAACATHSLINDWIISCLTTHAKNKLI